MNWVWVEIQTVLAVHEELIALHGGLPGLRDRGALEGALQRPQNLAYCESVEDPAVLAAAYLVAVAKAHAFADANKRSAWITAALFLELNNIQIEFLAEDALHLVVKVADSSLDLDQAAEWFRARVAAG